MRTLTALSLLALAAACVPDPGPVDGGGNNGCPTPTGAGTTRSNGSVNSAETWTAAESPYLITTDLSVYATLTLEPCTVVAIADKKTITVNPNGLIKTNGTADKRVRFENVSGTRWASMRFIGGKGDFAYTTFEGGGDPLNIVPDFQGVLDIRSSLPTPSAPDPVVKVNNVTISGSGSNGFRLQQGGGFTADSTALTITGSAAHAGSADGKLLGTLPPGNYPGNVIDDILVTDEGIRWDVTLHDRGVPYSSGGTNQSGVTSVGSPVTGGMVTVTVEPGVVWKFKPVTGLLQLDPGGSPSRATLIARGTAAKPIVFTSSAASPAAGDWLGIWMGGDGANNKLEYARIEYAGRLQGSSGSNSCQSLQAGTTMNGGALRIYSLPQAGLVSNVEFADIATSAIDRGWRDDMKPSFLAGNTFTRVGQCKETHPRDTNGACPTTPPCP